MGIAAAAAAIRTVMTASFSTAPVAWQNEAFTPPDGSAWVYAEVLGTGGDDSGFGSTGKRHATDIGIAFFHVFVPVGTGLNAPQVIAEEIGALFRMRTLARGMQCGAPVDGGAGSSDDEGNWFRVTVSIPLYLVYTV